MILKKSYLYDRPISRNFQNNDEELSSGYESSDSNQSQLKQSLRKVSSVFNIGNF